MKFLFAVLIVFNILVLNAQLATDNSLSPEFLAQSILSGNGVNISNVSFTGDPGSIGLFNGANTNLEIQYGLIMTTGTAGYDENGPHGPNDKPNAGFDSGSPGDSTLSQMVSANTFNAAILEFDLVANFDTLKLNYIFGSDEYPEYVGTQFNGVFAIFISGPGIPGGKRNIALIPNTSQPINVNTINHLVNTNYYISNGDGTEEPFNQEDQYIQYDGFTTKLTAYSQVIPGETYRLSIGIADVGDPIFDSGIFIEANSLSSGISESQKSKQIILYPNPNKGVFNIDKPSKNEVESLKIFSSTGRETSFKIEETNDAQLKIMIDNPKTGVYWVRFTSKSGAFYSSKFLIE